MPRTGVTDPRRLAAVLATGLLDTPAEEPFDRLARLAAAVLRTPFAFVTVVDDERSYWKSCIGVEDGGDLSARQNAVGDSFCQYVVDSGEALVVGDTLHHPVTCDNPSNDLMGVRAWAGFPVLAEGGEVLGTFCVVDTTERTWSAEDVQVLETLALAAGGEIELRARAEEARSLARALQLSLMPERLPDIPGLAIATRYRAAADGEGLLGDFLDVFEDGDDLVLVIGDVCGHGVEAAKLAALARWTMRTQSDELGHPGAFRPLAEAMADAGFEGDHAYLTSQVARLRLANDGAGAGAGVHLASAGHPPALVLREDGTVEEHGVGGQPIGFFPDAAVATGTVQLGAGDRLVLYTDGLTEARHDGVFLGEAAVHDLLAASAGLPVAALAARIEQAALDASGGVLVDDVAIIVVALRPT